MGAQALIIARDELTFVDSRIFHDSDSMLDGSAPTIDIPTLIVEREDGERLIAMVRAQANFDENIVMKADIEIVNDKSQTVSY